MKKWVGRGQKVPQWREEGRRYVFGSFQLFSGTEKEIRKTSSERQRYTLTEFKRGKEVVAVIFR